MFSGVARAKNKPTKKTIIFNQLNTFAFLYKHCVKKTDGFKATFELHSFFERCAMFYQRNVWVFFMYGMVNKFISTTVINRYGEQVWNDIKQSIDDYESSFIEIQPYSDDVTFGLVGACVTHLNVDAAAFLRQMGEDWVKETSQGSYRSMYALVSGGAFEFLSNLNNMHQVLVPPSFLCQKNDDDSITIHYYSTRDGLEPFVEGLLLGVCNYFNESATIRFIETKTEDTPFSTFRINFV